MDAEQRENCNHEHILLKFQGNLNQFLWSYSPNTKENNTLRKPKIVDVLISRRLYTGLGNITSFFQKAIEQVL